MVARGSRTGGERGRFVAPILDWRGARARSQQEAGAQQPRQAETNALLARLYGQAGDSGAARAALEAGLAAHPSDPELSDALAGLDG